MPEGTGSIISCYSVGTITLNIEKYNGSYQNSHVGTIVGLNDGGTVSSCYISTSDHATTIYIIVDDVDDKNLAPYVGPIYGQNDGGTVTNCWKDGYVKIETGICILSKKGLPMTRRETLTTITTFKQTLHDLPTAVSAVHLKAGKRVVRYDFRHRIYEIQTRRIQSP
ncbi:MAG: hypothetical protein ACLRSW_12420 [Christensenellaceae bacterium]